MRYLSFFTPQYEPHANVMLESFRRLGVEGLEILELENKPTWEVGNYIKVALIREWFRQGTPFVWMDCDTHLMKVPEFDESVRGVACRTFEPGTVPEGCEYACGVMYFGPDSGPIIEEWDSRCQEAHETGRVLRFADQSVFCEMVRENGWQHLITPLPREYNMRVNELVLKSPKLEDPVIFHVSQQTNRNREYLKTMKDRHCKGWPTGASQEPPSASSLRNPNKPHTIDLLNRLGEFLSPDCLGIEVGSSYGENAYHLLNKFPQIKRLFCVDPWDPVGIGGYVNRCFDGIHQPNIVSGRTVKTRLFSPDAARKFENNKFNFVYIDADHSYNAVRADCEAWWPKVRVGGVLCGHDWADILRCSITVEKAVRDWMASSKIPTEQLFLGTPESNNWYIRKTA